MNIQKPYFIVSPCKESYSKQANDLAVRMVEKFLWKKGIIHKIVYGVYKDICETSFVVFNECYAQSIAKCYEQECYFAVDSNGLASLHKPDGELLAMLGQLHSSKIKPKTDSYTYDDDTGTFYYT